MPNHVSTRLTITGSPDAVDRFKGMHIVTNPDGLQLFDFQTILPMPACLEGIPASSTMEMAVEAITGKNIHELVLEKRPDDEHAQMSLDMKARFRRSGDMDKRVKERLDTMPAADLEVGLRAIAAVEQCGYPTWYEWCVANWGTKWGAYDYKLLSESPGKFEFYYETAWSTAVPVLTKLAAMHTDLQFELHAFDEGWNFAAQGAGHNGHYLEVDVPTNEASYFMTHGCFPEKDDEDEPEEPVVEDDPLGAPKTPKEQ